MQGTKENRRMSSQHAVDNQMLVSGEHRHSIGETAPDIKARNVTEEKPHKKHHQKPINPPMYHDNNPEHYNADGTLRTQYQMPSSDTAWEQAQKARYIRSKDAVERDRELSVKEIFRKKDN